MTAREALKAFVDAIEWLEKGDTSGHIRKQFSILMSDARVVLARPERNCERFNNGLDAIHGWEDYLEKHPELPPSCMTSGVMIPWLFELSEEKGKANAST